MKEMQLSEYLYLTLSIAACVFFTYWGIHDGVVKKKISFGWIGNVTKTGFAAQIWGIIFASLGLLLLVLTIIFFVI